MNKTSATFPSSTKTNLLLLLNRIEHIKQAIQQWLAPGHADLQQAVEKTVSAGLFARHDIEFQLAVLRESMQRGELEEWVQMVDMLSPQNRQEAQKILCLHAGNLPLVGFQTALAVLLSGHDYYGKISRKDPWLLPSFLEEVQRLNLKQHIEYAEELENFEKVEADKVVFAGSEDSVPGVKKEIQRLNAARKEAKYIIRTAKFSVAYLNDTRDVIMEQLAEAVLRYGGQGCRSVGVIVSPFALSDCSGALRKAMTQFLEQNPQHLKPEPVLNYQQALNHGVGRSQVWLNDFLIQEAAGKPELDFCTHWVQGGPEKVTELKEKYGHLIQAVYAAGEDLKIDGEPLAEAQRPPLWWKPDGVDVLKELLGFG